VSQDEWPTRWNPNGDCPVSIPAADRHIDAQQGYLTVEINPTGSTTFGQSDYLISFAILFLNAVVGFMDAIKEDWGGKPFVDLRQGWKYILDNFPQERWLSPATNLYLDATI
jgi:hypothetical protein